MDTIPPDPPSKHSHCPYHRVPLHFAGTFDGEWSYECPASLCRITLYVSIPTSGSHLSALNSQPPIPHGHETAPQP